jgi:oxygen-dependent protoporphyrinogen oxidase
MGGEGGLPAKDNAALAARPSRTPPGGQEPLTQRERGKKNGENFAWRAPGILRHTRNSHEPSLSRLTHTRTHMGPPVRARPALLLLRAWLVRHWRTLAGCGVLWAVIHAVRVLLRIRRRYMRLVRDVLPPPRRPFALPRTARNGPPPVVAVLGAGVSGLAAAWRIKEQLGEKVEVHVLEAAAAPGGCIQTLTDVALGEQEQPGDGAPRATARLEAGPRSLRTTTVASIEALRIIDRLGLSSKLVWADKDTRGRRFIYDPATGELEELPTSLRAFMGFAWRHGVWSALLHDMACMVLPRKRYRQAKLGLETVHHFFKRHFSEHIADRFVSALVHGIYSGDSRTLTVRYIFRILWQLDAAYGSILLGMLLDKVLGVVKEHDRIELPVPRIKGGSAEGIQQAKSQSIASLRGGMHTLIEALVENLRRQGVHIHYGAEARQVSICTPTATAEHLVSITTAAGERRAADFVISALPPDELLAVLRQSSVAFGSSPDSIARHRAAVHAMQHVTSLSLAVVTFLFEKCEFAELVASGVQPGFGFLVPDVPYRGLLLGVVYDSCVFPDLPGRDNVVLTCMFGGGDPSSQRELKQASDTYLLELGRKSLQKILGVTRPPSVENLKRWDNAIPQFDGAYDRARSALLRLLHEDAPWLIATGKAFGRGVGVNDCMVGAVDAADQIVKIIAPH